MENTKQTGTLCAVLKKELFLSTHPAMYLFALLGFMTLIPYYPGIVGVGYIALAVFQADGIRRANNDLEFTLLLPIKRSFVVWGKTLSVIVMETLTLFCASAGAIIAYFVMPGGNSAMIDPNLSFFGIAFICLGAFNLIYTAGFFKTGYKSGMPTLFGAIAIVIIYSLFELLLNVVSAFAVLDGYGADGFVARLLFCVVGTLVFGALTLLGVKIGQKNFEKVSL